MLFLVVAALVALLPVTRKSFVSTSCPIWTATSAVRKLNRHFHICTLCIPHEILIVRAAGWSLFLCFYSIEVVRHDN